ncbi:MAG TPA: ArsR family transcriptional regulator [bacterium (Candidatus Stahlbacteria)]|nr:ArsR family transcriptional regulator [Candidatus Stahlbacteria bacterium]
MKRKQLPETDYRASRICRVLGNPTAYQIMKMLIKSPKKPTDLSVEIGLSLKTISDTLRNLRQVDIVRYDTKHRNKIYFIKDQLILKIIKSLETYVRRMRIKKR